MTGEINKKLKKRKNYIYLFLENASPEPVKVAHGTEGFRGTRFENHHFKGLRYVKIQNSETSFRGSSPARPPDKVNK
jgi:hypothetical protein